MVVHNTLLGTENHPPLGKRVSGTDYPLDLEGEGTNDYQIRDDNLDSVFRVGSVTASEIIEISVSGSTREYQVHAYVDSASTDAFDVLNVATGRANLRLDTVNLLFAMGNSTDSTMRAQLFGHLDLQELAGDPGATANAGKLYTKDVSTVTELFFQASDGTVTQITPGGGGGNTLDGAYDQGGAGAGRIITADTGAVEIQGTDGLTITTGPFNFNSTAGADDFTLTMGTNSVFFDLSTSASPSMLIHDGTNDFLRFFSIGTATLTVGDTTANAPIMLFNLKPNASNALIIRDASTNSYLTASSATATEQLIYGNTSASAPTHQFGLRGTSTQAFRIVDGAADIWFEIDTSNDEITFGNINDDPDFLFLGDGLFTVGGTHIVVNADATLASNEDPYLSLLGGDGAADVVRTLLYQDSTADAAHIIVGLTGDTIGQTTRASTVYVGPAASSSTDTDIAFGLRGYTSGGTERTMTATFDVSANQVNWTTGTSSSINFNPGNHFFAIAGGNVDLRAGSAGQIFLDLADNRADALRIYDGTNNYITIDTTNNAEQIDIVTPNAAVEQDAGDINLTLGVGGAASSGAGGEGGDFLVVAGAGGAGTAGLGAGPGGDITLTAGAAGADNGGGGQVGGFIRLTCGAGTGGQVGGSLELWGAALGTIDLGNFSAQIINIGNGSATTTNIGVGTSAAIGFFGATAVARPTVTGSRGGNAALADLLTDLASLGLITDSTSA